MPQPRLFNNQGLEPAVLSELAFPSSAALPFGAVYPQGAALGLIGGAAANAALTLTLTKNSATGLKGYFSYTSGDRLYSGLVAAGGITANAATAFPSAAQMQAALEATVPAWRGNITVTGSDSANYTITFNNLMAAKRYGGTLTFTVTAYTAGSGPTGAITIATAGSCGAGQYGLYNTGSTPGAVDAFLRFDTILDPGGNPVGEFPNYSGQAASGYPIWAGGIFYADGTNYAEKSVLVGSGLGYVDSAALSVTNSKLHYYKGSALTDAGCMLKLG